MARWVVALDRVCAVTSSSPAAGSLRRPPGLSEMVANSLSGVTDSGEEVGGRWMMDVSLSWRVPWGEQSLTSEKPVLHYITHTEDSRERLPLEGVRCEHVRNGEIPAGCREISLASHRARCGGRHHPFPNSRQSRCCAAGHPAEEGRARAGPAPLEARGTLGPRPENATLFPILFQAPLAEQRGGRPRRSPDSAGRRRAPRFFSGRLGVPRARITLQFAKSCIFPLAAWGPAFAADGKDEHSDECPRTTRMTAVGAHATTLRERRHTPIPTMEVLSG